MEDTDVHFALVGARGTAGIAQGRFNLSDDIAEIGHGVVTPPATYRVQKNGSFRQGLITTSAVRDIYYQNGAGLIMEPSG